MLGRKAIHHKKNPEKKRKWQHEVSDDKTEEEVDLHKLVEEMDSPKDEPDRIVEDSDEEGTDMECSDGEGMPKKKKKRFAWMDSGDEGVSDDSEDDQEIDEATSVAPSQQEVAPEPISKHAVQNLSPAMIALASRVNTVKSFNELWECIDMNIGKFTAYHICAALKKVVQLKENMPQQKFVYQQWNQKTNDLRLEKISAFIKLRELAFDSLNNEIHTWAPHDLGTFAMTYAKCIQPVPSDLYGHIAKESLSRIKTFSASSISELAWGVAQTTLEDGARFFEEYTTFITIKFDAMTLEDLGRMMTALAIVTYRSQVFFDRFFTHMKNRLSPMIPGDAPQYPGLTMKPFLTNAPALIDVVQGCANLGMYDEDFMNSVAKVIQSKIYELKSPQLQALLNSFDELRHDSDVDFLRLVRRALDSRNQNNPYYNRKQAYNQMKYITL